MVEIVPYIVSSLPFFVFCCISPVHLPYFKRLFCISLLSSELDCINLILCPSASLVFQPYIFSAPLFQSVIKKFVSNTKIASEIFFNKKFILDCVLKTLLNTSIIETFCCCAFDGGLVSL